MKARRPVRTKDGWLTMLPYSGANWCAFFEAVGHPECIEEFSVRDPVARARNIDQYLRSYARHRAEQDDGGMGGTAAVDRRAAHGVRQVVGSDGAAASEGGRAVPGGRPSDRGHAPPGAAAGAVLRQPGGVHRWRHGWASTRGRCCGKPATTRPRSRLAEGKAVGGVSRLTTSLIKMVATSRLVGVPRGTAGGIGLRCGRLRSCCRASRRTRAARPDDRR